MGGTGNIIKGFEKLMNEVGIKIIKGHEVKKIIFNGNKITGVQLDNQTIIKLIMSFVMQIHRLFMKKCQMEIQINP